MNINRHNYEEFFLLYVDDELTAAERSVVETFTAANPDLKEELELLQQSTFTVDAKLDETFKSSLLKPVEATVTEEQLLLFIDDELRIDEAASVLKAATEDAVLQKELHLLQRSKFTPDASIVFPDKSLLYKEAQPARVFYMSTVVRRWSAAAAVLLMLGTGVWLMNKNSNTASVVDGSTTPVKVVEPKTDNKVETVVPPVQNNELVQQQPTIESNTTPAVKQKTNTIVTIVEQKKKDDAIAVEKNQQKQTQQPFVPQPENQTIIDPNTTVKTDVTPKNNPDKSNNPPTSSVQPETSTAKTTISFVNNEDDGDEDEQAGLLNENRQRSTGLKALLKKAKRTFERRTGVQSGDSQVRFAVFAVNTQ
jgi:anti-sigma factor RsiW